MDGSNNNKGNNPAPSAGSENLNDGERAKIATALRLGQVASKAAELSQDKDIFSEGEAKAIEEKGDVSLILAEADKQDMSNAVKEAVNKKIASGKVRLLTNNFIVKPFLTAYYAARASRAIEKAGGDASAAYTELGLDDSSRINKGGDDYTKRRARLALEESGFDRDKVDSESSFALSEGEKVEKVQDEKTKELNDTLKNLFNDLKDAKKAKDEEAYDLAWDNYNKQIEQWQESGTFGNNQANALSKLSESKPFRFLFGNNFNNKSVTELSALKKAGEGVKALVEHENSIDGDKFAQYLEEGHISLYNADLKAGLNTKQLVNNVTAAVLAGGAIGGVFYSISSYKAKIGAKGQMAGQLAGVAAHTNAITGALVGAAAGAVRGVQHARVKISESEIEHAISKDEGDVLLTAEEKAEQAKAKAEAEAEAAKANQDNASGASDNENAKTGANESGEGNNNAELVDANKAKKIANIFGKIANIKKKVTKEDEILNAIEEKRNRKSAKELYEAIDRDAFIVKLFNAENKDARKKLINELKDVDSEALNAVIDKVITDERMRTIDKKGKKSKEHLEGADKLKEKERNALFMRLLDNKGNSEIAKNNLKDALADAKARSTISARMKIDLIKFSTGNTAKERSMLAEKMAEVKDLVDSEKLKEAISDKIDSLSDENKAANKEATRLMIRQALTDAAIGALTGGIFGAIKDKVEADKAASMMADSSKAEGASDSAPFENGTDTGSVGEADSAFGEQSQTVSFKEDPDGGYAMFVGEGENRIQIAGEGDAAGVNFDLQTGRIAEADLEMLRNQGYNIEEVRVDTEMLTGGRGTMSAEDFFNIEKHAEKFGDKADDAGFKVENVSIKGWVSAANSNRAADITSFETVNEGDLTARVVTLDEGVSTEGLKVVLRPSGQSEAAFTFDVA